jgi:CheY-like chemotaxis protein
MARILVIEDDDSVRTTVKQMLESGGHQVATAVDGEDGLEQFQKAPADLVLCDVFMPNKTGIGTLTSLRKISGTLPIVVMSGGAPSSGRISKSEFVDYLEMAKLFGATATIGKPFKAADLIEVISKALATGGSPAAQ